MIWLTWIISCTGNGTSFSILIEELCHHFLQNNHALMRSMIPCHIVTILDHIGLTLIVFFSVNILILTRYSYVRLLSSRNNIFIWIMNYKTIYIFKSRKIRYSFHLQVIILLIYCNDIFVLANFQIKSSKSWKVFHSFCLYK